MEAHVDRRQIQGTQPVESCQGVARAQREGQVRGQGRVCTVSLSASML